MAGDGALVTGRFAHPSVVHELARVPKTAVTRLLHGGDAYLRERAASQAMGHRSTVLKESMEGSRPQFPCAAVVCVTRLVVFADVRLVVHDESEADVRGRAQRAVVPRLLLRRHVVLSPAAEARAQQRQKSRKHTVSSLKLAGAEGSRLVLRARA